MGYVRGHWRGGAPPSSVDSRWGCAIAIVCLPLLLIAAVVYAYQNRDETPQVARPLYPDAVRPAVPALEAPARHHHH